MNPTGTTGRPVKHTRAALLAAIAKQPGTFTGDDLITALGWEKEKAKSFVASRLRRLAEEFVIERAGGKAKARGQGNRSVLWQKARIIGGEGER